MPAAPISCLSCFSWTNQGLSIRCIAPPCKTGKRFRFPVLALTANPYFFLFWIMSCMIGDRMISIAWLILPPGTTRVLARDMKEFGIICR